MKLKIMIQKKIFSISDDDEEKDNLNLANIKDDKIINKIKRKLSKSGPYMAHHMGHTWINMCGPYVVHKKYFES